MTKLEPQNHSARDFFEGEFAAIFPNTYRSLTEVAMAGADLSRALRARYWFGRGDQKRRKMHNKYAIECCCLAVSLDSEEALSTPVLASKPKMSATDELMRAFFVAYPNWQDAEQAWQELGAAYTARTYRFIADHSLQGTLDALRAGNFDWLWRDTHISRASSYLDRASDD